MFEVYFFLIVLAALGAAEAIVDLWTSSGCFLYLKASPVFLALKRK